ncbi:MAG: hypothetical protein KF841_01050 [Phycisphaerae bacterium]|nr:hypothetical protein [Phycisphaerae bacterium]
MKHASSLLPWWSDGLDRVRLCVLAVVLLQAITPRLRADDFWQSLGGPTGGSVNCLARDPMSGAIFAGTGFQNGYNQNAGSVFKSIDHGDSWTYISADFFTLAPPITTRVRAIATNSLGHVFVGLESGGIMRSVDGGAGWSRLNNGLGELRIRSLAVSPSDAIFTATDTLGVWAFSAAGNSWTAVNDGLTSLDTRALIARNDYLLVGTQTGGVFKKLAGQSWTSSSNGMSNLRVNGLTQSLTTDELFAATDTGFFSSIDHAASWQPVVGPFTGSICWTLLDTGSFLLAGTSAGIFKSTNGGTDWVSVSDGFTGTAARTLLADGTGRVYAGSFDAGVFRSVDDAQSWEPVNNGLHGLSVIRLLVTSEGRILAGTPGNGIYRSTIFDGLWTGPRLPRRNIFAIAESPAGEIFAGNYNITNGVPDGHPWRSEDGGETWVSLDNGIAAAMVSAFAFPGGVQVLCTSAWNPGGVSQSANRGDLWSRLGPPQNIPAYCLTRVSGGDLFFGTEGQGVWRYNAGSGTWSNLGLSQSQQFSIAVNSAGHVFVGNDGNIKGVYKSLANGDGLQPLNAFPGNYGYTICILPNDDIYVGTRDNGIQFSNDGGTSWIQVNSGIPVRACQAICVGPDGHLYAAVAGFGVYRSVSQVVQKMADDIDGDGDIDIVDVELFAEALIGIGATPIHLWRSDLDASGRVDGADIALFVQAAVN